MNLMYENIVQKTYAKINPSVYDTVLINNALTAIPFHFYVGVTTENCLIFPNLPNFCKCLILTL